MTFERKSPVVMLTVPSSAVPNNGYRLSIQALRVQRMNTRKLYAGRIADTNSRRATATQRGESLATNALVEVEVAGYLL